MGAGVLPCAYNKGKLYILLGRERKNNLWCDFGGSPEQGETVFDTAVREGMEELNGFFGTIEELSAQVEQTHIENVHNHRDKYTSILFKIKYDPKLPRYFNYNNSFNERHVLPLLNAHEFGRIRPTGLFEKTEMKWFNIAEIDETDLSEFRPHFAVILKNILKREAKIMGRIDDKNLHRSQKTRKRNKK